MHVFIFKLGYDIYLLFYFYLTYQQQYKNHMLLQKKNLVAGRVGSTQPKLDGGMAYLPVLFVYALITYDCSLP